MTFEELARIHTECFAIPRPWSAVEFQEMLGLPGTFLLLRPGAFLLGRIVLDEAELLTVAVAPDRRREGLGHDLVHSFAAASRERGAVTAFLEVAADNSAALALYKAAGWVPAGRRRRYYGAETDALVMRLAFAQDQNLVDP